MKPITIAALALMLATASAGASEQKRFTATNAAWQEECGGCHLAFPPDLLPGASWRALMATLDQHFGTDATLDAAKQNEIAGFLAANAGRREATRSDGKPALRITETAWFRHEHRDGEDGITPGIWKSPAVKTAANCGACHTQAARGDYSERNTRVPN